eukprot:526969-Pleurochrysis_carterae.AAC.1
MSKFRFLGVDATIASAVALPFALLPLTRCCSATGILLLLVHGKAVVMDISQSNSYFQLTGTTGAGCASTLGILSSFGATS